jgi:hypothetical protein
MKQREGYYMVIPAKVWDTDLSEKAILTYGHISVLVKKEGYCYANNSYFMKKLRVEVSSIKRYLKALEDKGLIKRVIIYEEDGKTIKERRIYLMDQPGFMDEPRPMVTDEPRPGFTDGPDNNTSNNNTSNNIISITKWDKLYEKLIEGYPKNRLQTKPPVIKLLKSLTKEQIELVLKNKQRYLDSSNGMVKNLRKYIEEECYTEEWLQAQNETNNSFHSRNTKPDTKTLNKNATNYDNF